MNKYIQLTSFQSFLFHFQMLWDSSHIFLLMISIVCGGYRCTCVCGYMNLYAYMPVKNNGYLFYSAFVNFIVSRQIFHWTWDLSFWLVGLDSSQDLSILARLQPHALGLKVHMARPGFMWVLGNSKSGGLHRKHSYPLSHPLPHHRYLLSTWAENRLWMISSS